ncbi:MAG TPA: discoidin domain-containing protein, partial [Chryseosolibacter sp.]
TMHDALTRSGQPLKIFGSPMEAETSYLTPELLSLYQALFEEAEAKVHEDPEVLERVRIARLPLNYAIMEQAKKHYVGERGVFRKVNGQWQARTDIRATIDPFTDLLIRQGVTQVKEWSTTPEEYRSAMYRLLSQGMNEHLAFGKGVTFIAPDSLRLPPHAATMLTDGIRGSHDYAYNWLAFSGQDLEAIVDLGDLQTVKRIESSYYQYAFWLRVLPKEVEYFISLDGKKFTPVGRVENTLPIDQYGGHQRDFILEFAPQPARFIKVKAHTIGNTPAWHPGGGRAANMLVDEIVVE